MYKVVLLPEAQKFYHKLFYSNREIFERIRHALESLKENPLLGKSLKYKLRGKYSLRVGIYRIIYSVDHLKITIYVFDIGHRKAIYQ